MGGQDLGALTKGDHVWAMHDDKSWVPCRYKGKEKGKLVVTIEEVVRDGTKGALLFSEGDTFSVDKSDKKCVVMKSLREGDIHDAVEDMQRLNDVHEASLLHTLRTRLGLNNIYTWTGPILISVNPYFVLPLYGADIMLKYNNKAPEDNPPHVYGIGDSAYRQMLNKGKNQSMIIRYIQR